MQKKILFSGIQPTSHFTLGNYLGAIKNWVKLQEEFQCFFSIVDLHAITVRQEPKKLYEQTYKAIATYLACGIDPEKNCIFIQSHIPAHAELAWILSCFTPLGELNRMTQFKEKTAKKEKIIGSGLLFYPILMAADILLYQTHLVVVGEDQKQHLELTRNLAIRMNHIYKKKLFQIPEIYLPKIGARIMSLQNPLLKMSKSDPSPQGTIYLTDTDSQIQTKLKRAITDSGTEIVYNETKPGIKNLIQIQAALKEASIEEIVPYYTGKNYGDLKTDTAELIIKKLGPIRNQVEELMKDPSYLHSILQRGTQRAQQIAEKTLAHIHEQIGFIGKKSINL